MYIYAFPVQQTLADCWAGARSPYLLMLAASLLVLPLAAASWFLVERPALRAKNVLKQRRSGEEARPSAEAVPISVPTA